MGLIIPNVTNVTQMLRGQGQLIPLVQRHVDKFFYINIFFPFLCYHHSDG